MSAKPEPRLVNGERSDVDMSHLEKQGMRYLYESERYSVAQLAEMGRTTCDTARRVLATKSWVAEGWSCGDQDEECETPHVWPRPNAKLTDDDVKNIKMMRQNATLSKIAKKFGVSRGHVSNLVNGRRRKTNECSQ